MAASDSRIFIACERVGEAQGINYKVADNLDEIRKSAILLRPQPYFPFRRRKYRVKSTSHL